MIITRLEPIDQKRYKVFIDYEYCFMLYNTDIRRYKIAEDGEISVETYDGIIKDTVYRRAKQKAIAILKYMDRTELELRNKLKQAYYSDEIVERTIEFVMSYHYIDDARFTTNYITSKKATKSKKQIQVELYRKGIDKTLMEQYLDNELENDDIAIQKAIRKKTQTPKELTLEEKQKLIASLCRKGFLYEDVIRFL